MDNQVSILDMSDEEIAKLDTSFLASTPNNTEPENKQDEVVEEIIVEETKVETTNEDQSQGNEESTTKSTDEVIEESNKTEDSGKPENKEPAVEVDKAPKQEGKEETTESKQDETVTPEAQLAALFAPFKANGRDMKVENIEEARQLMQMGAGFNKRMGQLKPALKLVKMLENNGLMDEAKLGFLIDVNNKNPEAISKLLQESGVDPLDMDKDKAEKYVPKKHSVSENELALDEVLQELDDSPAIARTLKVVASDWDETSKAEILRQPQHLKVINTHVENGIFDLIDTEIQRQKALGGLQGLSNIQAYQQVGDAMNAAGKFAHLFSGSSTASQQTPKAAPVVVQPKLKQAENDEQRDKKRKAASGTPQTVSQTKPVVGKSPLDMSDEEFAKFNPKFS